MTEFRRGVVSGLISGTITGVIFSIILVMVMFSLSFSFLGYFSEAAGLIITGVIFATFIFAMIISVVYGTVLGLILSVIIPRIKKLKEVYVAVITSVLLFYLSSLPKLLSSALADYAGLVSVFLISFGLVEGLVFNYFWNKFER